MQVETLLAELLTFQAPADQVIDRFFRANRRMGSRDRAFAAETAYGVLRHLREVRCVAQALELPETPAALLSTGLVLHGGWSPDDLRQTPAADFAHQLAGAARAWESGEWSAAERLNLTDDAWTRLAAELPAAELAQLAHALNSPAPVDLRVNVLRASREAVAAQLGQAGFECSPTPYSPLGLRRARRGPLFHTDAFRDGLIEVQDEGSQLIGLLLGARPGKRVVDFCAGAGGKTLLLAAEMRNRGEVIACDVSERRLRNMRARLKRAQLDNVRCLVLQDEADPCMAGYRSGCDAVLVDAPCSGSGTWRRNPDMKWRPFDLGELQELQGRILQNAAALVKPGGRLVYATCSLYRAENQEVIGRFLDADSRFSLVPAAAALQKNGVPDASALTDPDGMMRLLPHRHGTDGFFAAVMQRTGAADVS